MRSPCRSLEITHLVLAYSWLPKASADRTCKRIFDQEAATAITARSSGVCVQVVKDAFDVLWLVMPCHCSSAKLRQDPPIRLLPHVIADEVTWPVWVQSARSSECIHPIAACPWSRTHANPWLMSGSSTREQSSPDTMPLKNVA
jgi:hypothetical protein